MCYSPRIEAQVIADSLSGEGHRLTTFVLTYPRFIHSEFMTHRQISRNAASSRAIPIKRTLIDVIDQPACPVHFGRVQKGMQAEQELSGTTRALAKLLWLWARWPAVVIVWLLSKLGLHKQAANRLLEPWLHITVIASATEWDNFFVQRAHPAAQPEFQRLAYAMLRAMNESIPKRLYENQWHLPFGIDLPDSLSVDEMVAVCTARCARVSYKLHDGTTAIHADLELYERLKGSGHWSPFEHCAKANGQSGVGRSSNFKGFTQHRKEFIGELTYDMRLIKHQPRK